MKTLLLILPFVLPLSALADSQTTCTFSGLFRPHQNQLVMNESNGNYSYTLEHCMHFAHVPVGYPLCSTISSGPLTFDSTSRVYQGEQVRIVEMGNGFTLEDLRPSGTSYDFDSCQTH